MYIKLIATGEVQQITAFAELYAEKTRNIQQLARTAHYYACAAQTLIGLPSTVAAIACS